MYPGSVNSFEINRIFQIYNVDKSVSFGNLIKEIISLNMQYMHTYLYIRIYACLLVGGTILA